MANVLESAPDMEQPPHVRTNSAPPEDLAIQPAFWAAVDPATAGVWEPVYQQNGVSSFDGDGSAEEPFPDSGRWKQVRR